MEEVERFIGCLAAGLEINKKCPTQALSSLFRWTRLERQGPNYLACFSFFCWQHLHFILVTCYRLCCCAIFPSTMTTRQKSWERRTGLSTKCFSWEIAAQKSTCNEKIINAINTSVAGRNQRTTGQSTAPHRMWRSKRMKYEIENRTTGKKWTGKRQEHEQQPTKRKRCKNQMVKHYLESGPRTRCQASVHGLNSIPYTTSMILLSLQNSKQQV